MGTRCVRLALLLLAVVLQYAAAGGAPPSLCDACPDPKAATCDATKGCVAGGPTDKHVDASNKCIFKCKDDSESLLTDTAFAPLGISLLKCESGKWIAPDDGDKVATEAVCIKKISCHKKFSHKPACSAITDKTVGCEEVTFNDDNVKSCTGSKKFFIKGANNWKDGGKQLTCLDKMGVWKSATGDLKDGETVICADRNPDENCKAVPPPKKTCPTTLPKFVDCKELSDVVSGSCQNTHKKYFTDGATNKWEEIGNVACAAGNKWNVFDMQNKPKPATSADTVICAKFPPESKACSPSQMTASDCANLGGDCVKVAIPPERGAIDCKGKTKYIMKSGENKWVDAVKIECDIKKGKWMQGTNLDYEMKPADKVVCSNKDPAILSCDTRSGRLTSTCPANVAYAAECVEISISKPDTAPDACATGSHYIQHTDDSWSELPGLKCDTKTGNWEYGPTPIPLDKAAVKFVVVCAKENPALISCSKAYSLSDGCTNSDMKNHLGNCEPVPPHSNDGDIACVNQLYFKRAQGGTFMQTSKIECDTKTGKWTDQASNTQLVAGDFAICIDDDPTKRPKECVTFEAECGPILNCGKPIFDQKVPVTCTTANQILYFNKDFGPFQKVSDNLLKCDTDNGVWQQGNNMDPLDATDVICGKDDAPPTIPDGTCPMLKTTCLINWKSKNGCEKPTSPFDTPVCTPGKKFYFKKAGVAAFQEAKHIKCAEGKWELEYTFGTSVNRKEEMVAGDHLICADSNPDPEVCEFKKVQLPANYNNRAAPPAQGKFEAGKSGSCGDDRFDFLNANKEAIRHSIPPICNPDGSWSDPSGEKLFGEKDKVMCAIKKCRDCKKPNPSTLIYPTVQSNEARIEHGGECSAMACNAEGYYILKMDNDEYHTFAGRIPCTDDQAFKLDGHEIVELDCVQQLYCIESGVVHVNMECPSDNSIPDCVPVAVTDDQGTPEVLSCTAGKKLFIRDDTKDELYWDEITDPTITCDVKTGKWPVNVVGGTQEEKRGHHHTIICADSNPKPKSTTTTTTTTPAPLLPICEVCSGLQFYRDCKECVNSTKLEDKSSGEKGPDDKCLLKPNEGASLLYNNFQTVSDYLQCVRSDGTWKTATGAYVNRIISQLKAKEDKWLTLSYLIVGGAFLAIGGMAIGCVVIYMRMRKQLSSREKKKKERGVTKKYTSSNVVKTNTKTDGGSRESSKSKVSGSKMDDNLEDTPTLKIY